MGREISRIDFDDEDYRRFTSLLRDETDRLLAFAGRGGFHDPRFVAGFELEAWLLDHACYPLPVNQAFLQRLSDPLVVPELSRYNVEVNGTPQPFMPGALLEMERQLEATWRHTQEVAHGMDAVLAMIGTLPTLREQDLDLGEMSALKRYVVLNEQIMKQRRGQPIKVRVSGADSLHMVRRDVMLEAATTSFQVHFQIPEGLSGRYYNASLIAAAPLLLVGANSPFLFGRRLWHETRIPLFEQSIEVGGHAGLDDPSVRRAGFGTGYVKASLLELFAENVRLFPVLLPIVLDEPGESYPHVRLHNGCIWRWVRPLIGRDASGAAHVRIEQRVLPSGPTVVDMLANAAFYYGMTRALAGRPQLPEDGLPFDAARENLYAAARLGLAADLMWTEGRRLSSAKLLRELLPMARDGLAELGLAEEEIERYLGVVESRVASGQTGAVWQLRHHERIGGDSLQLMADYLEHQRSGIPVHEWDD